MNLSISRHTRARAGVALIEVMISLLIVSVGLLGIAKMHALAIGNTQVAGSRALASIYAASLSSAMHANRAYWQAGLAPASTTVVGTTIGDATLNGQTANCIYSSANTSPSCTPVQMASADLKTWGQSLLQLPGGNGLVACSTTVGLPVTCTVKVSWNEKYVGLNTGTLNSSQQTATKTFIALVEP
ncbi:type IV pilus modification protein PilV [Curvibacter lanceolatus]|jgi:type IV pilus assembly protein PilV|uniref:type IV pilus modification protein PilV n=1 Tax=Curvibacter lanceolatus TaxID=86182 RepID=UPI0003A6DCA3|nr:type IV pilus modification protein PilV [Curvibacter lanceolatus]